MASCSRGPILVVDDDIDIRDVLHDTLEEEGYAVVEATGGHQALIYLRDNPLPALILLDWNMAPMNGAQFTDEFAKEKDSGLVPIVILSADSRVRAKIEMSRYAGCLSKPVDLNVLFALLDRLIRC